MQIRPKSFGENLNEWFRAMGRTWRTMLALCAIIYVPLGLLTTALLIIPGTLDAYFDLIGPDVELQTPAELMEALGPLLWVGAIWTVLQLVATVVIYIAAGRAVAASSAGVEETASGLLRFAWRRLGSGLGAGLILVVALVVSLTAVTLVGWRLISALGADFLPIFLTSVIALTGLTVIIWLGVGVSLYPQTIAMTDAGATESLSSSFRLVRGRWWPTLGFELVTGLVVSAVAQVLSFVLVPVLLIGLIAPAFLAVGYGLATMLQGPVAAAMGLAYAVWYIDLQARETSLTSNDLT